MSELEDALGLARLIRSLSGALKPFDRLANFSHRFECLRRFEGKSDVFRIGGNRSRRV